MGPLGAIDRLGPTPIFHIQFGGILFSRDTIVAIEGACEWGKRQRDNIEIMDRYGLSGQGGFGWHTCV